MIEAHPLLAKSLFREVFICVNRCIVCWWSMDTLSSFAAIDDSVASGKINIQVFVVFNKSL